MGRGRADARRGAGPAPREPPGSLAQGRLAAGERRGRKPARRGRARNLARASGRRARRWRSARPTTGSTPRRKPRFGARCWRSVRGSARRGRWRMGRTSSTCPSRCCAGLPWARRRRPTSLPWPAKAGAWQAAAKAPPPLLWVGDGRAVRGVGTSGRPSGASGSIAGPAPALPDAVLVARTLLPTELPLWTPQRSWSRPGARSTTWPRRRVNGACPRSSAPRARRIAADGDLVLVRRRPRPGREVALTIASAKTGFARRSHSAGGFGNPARVPIRSSAPGRDGSACRRRPGRAGRRRPRPGREVALTIASAKAGFARRGGHPAGRLDPSRFTVDHRGKTLTGSACRRRSRAGRRPRPHA